MASLHSIDNLFTNAAIQPNDPGSTGLQIDPSSEVQVVWATITAKGGQPFTIILSRDQPYRGEWIEARFQPCDGAWPLGAPNVPIAAGVTNHDGALVIRENVTAADWQVTSRPPNIVTRYIDQAPGAGTRMDLYVAGAESVEIGGCTALAPANLDAGFSSGGLDTLSLQSFAIAPGPWAVATLAAGTTGSGSGVTGAAPGCWAWITFSALNPAETRIRGFIRARYPRI